MILTDTHCHLDFEAFNNDREAVIQRAIEAGVTRILIPALDWESSLSAIKLAKTDPRLFAAVGFHPASDIEKWNKGTIENLRASAKPADKIVAIGEIGLDYYWETAPHDHQQSVFREQLELATELGLPVIIHLREMDDDEHGACAEDAMSILEEWANRLRRSSSPLAERPGVLHSFSGSVETAKRAISLNFLIGITGPVTFKNAKNKHRLVSALPLERLVIESDAPFLTPVPHRGKRNEPAFVRHIADKIGEIHSKHPEEIAAVTSANAARLFAWGD